MYEMEVHDSISTTMENLKELTERIIIDYGDEYNDCMTYEEMEMKSLMDYYCWNEKLSDDEFVNKKDFFDDITDIKMEMDSENGDSSCDPELQIEMGTYLYLKGTSINGMDNVTICDFQ